MGKKNNEGMFMVARKQFEHAMVVRIVERCAGNKTEAARVLGISYATLKSIVKDGRDKAKSVLSGADKTLSDTLKLSVLGRLNGEKPSDLSTALNDYVTAVRIEMLEAIRSGLGLSSKA